MKKGYEAISPVSNLKLYNSKSLLNFFYCFSNGHSGKLFYIQTQGSEVEQE